MRSPPDPALRTKGANCRGSGTRKSAMPYLVSYVCKNYDMATSVSDETAALRLAAAFEAQGLAGVAIRDGRSGEVYSVQAFRSSRLRGGSGMAPLR